MKDVKFNFNIPHSKDECIPRILGAWFQGVELVDNMNVKLTVEQLKEMLRQAHEEGRMRQLESTSNRGLPPLK